jgi:hypothetical protein
MPEGRIWGSTAGVDIDRDGSSIWVAERCGAQGFIPPSQMREGEVFNRDGSNLDPILKFDASGKLVKKFRAGLFVFRHGLSVDFEGNVWVTDGVGRGAKGQTVHKFRSSLPVVFSSGYALDTLVEKGLASARSIVLTKPYRKAELALRIREALTAGAPVS